MIKCKLLLLLILFSTVAYTSFSVQPADAASWLSGWTYRKRHILTGSAGAGIGYQMMFKIIRGSGTDEGNIVYVSDKCKEDFSDVRFADAQGNTFPYAVTYMTTDEAWFWIKPSVDLDVNQTIYIYYGNQDAQSESNLDATFVFAEPWDNNTLNERWTIETGTWNTNFVIDTSKHRLKLMSSSNIGAAQLRSTKTDIVFPSSFRVESFSAQQYDAAYDSVAFTFGAYTYAQSSGYSTRGDWSVHNAPFSDRGVAYNSLHGYISGGASYSKAKVGVGHNDDYSASISSGYRERKWLIVRNSSNYFNMYYQENLVWTELNTESPNRLYLRYTNNHGSTFYAYVYAFKIRKFVDPEPGHGEWFAEETYGGVKSQVNVYAYPSWIPNGVFKLDLETCYMPYSGETEPGTHTLTALDEQITINASHIYNFKCWKKDGAVYSYEATCQFTIDMGENVEFTLVYEAYTVNVSTTPEGLKVNFEADGWELETPTTIFRGPRYHTFRASTTTIYYNSTHMLNFMGWYVNDLFISTDEILNLYIAKNSTIKIAYAFAETPSIPPMTFRAQLITLGELPPGTTKDFIITVLFDQSAITITRITFQTKTEWFQTLTPLPFQASRGMETLGTATIQASLTVPANVQGYYNIPFTVTATTPQNQNITTVSYITFTITTTPSIAETTLTQGGFVETIKRLLGNPILLLLLIALIAWLASYSLKKH
ncbi:hypothetical protein DRO69_12785 [Candidatus Bathyarchaeota archaeon]|nr:MAG: hypothetical protein DRO69_12785 [Candidatus Bathyarchaeota archaeon]